MGWFVVAAEGEALAVGSGDLVPAFVLGGAPAAAELAQLEQVLLCSRGGYRRIGKPENRS